VFDARPTAAAALSWPPRRTMENEIAFFDLRREESVTLPLCEDAPP
jgi:hypothetical protein